MKIDVYLYGTVCLSTIHVLDGDYPVPDSYREIRRTYVLPSGEAANAALLLSGFGLAVKMDGPFLGYRTREPITGFYRGRGIDLSGFRYDPGFPGVEDMVLVVGRGRTVFGTYGMLHFAGGRRWSRPDPRAIAAAATAGIDPYLQEDSRRAAQYCLESGKRYVTNDVAPEDFLNAHAAVTIVSGEFIHREFPDIDVRGLFRRYAALAGGLVIFTFGNKTMLYGRAGGEPKTFAPFPVKAKGSLAAGDFFRAAAIYALHRRLPDERLMELSAAAGALACARFPAALDPPRLEEVRRLADSRRPAPEPVRVRAGARVAADAPVRPLSPAGVAIRSAPAAAEAEEGTRGRAAAPTFLERLAGAAAPYARLCRNSFLTALSFRGRTLLFLFSETIAILAQFFLWRALFEHGGAVNGIEFRDMITYFILNSLLGALFRMRVGERLAAGIYDGSIASDLLRPLRLKLTYAAFESGGILADLLLRFLPPALVWGALFAIRGPASPGALVSALFFLAAGLVINHQTEMIIGQTAFWLQETWYLPWFHRALLVLFSGSLVPLWFYPEGLRRVAEALPFRFTSFVPLSLYLGKIDPASLPELAAWALGWIAALGLLERLVWVRGVRQIVVHGG
jgi:ABC-type uncharacterized transport system permease subunit/sugar/nucleoside kinase (ribokinase family)